MDFEILMLNDSQNNTDEKPDLIENINSLEVTEIEGGSIKNSSAPIQFQEAKHKADTTRKLANWLIIILAGSIILQYACTMWLELSGRHDSVENLNRIFNSLLPVIAGLAGSAVTYYFTREK